MQSRATGALMRKLTLKEHKVRHETRKTVYIK